MFLYHLYPIVPANIVTHNQRTYIYPFSNRNGLIILNSVFITVDVSSIAICISSNSLHSFFKGTAFVSLTFIEGLKNLIFSGILCFFGIKLVIRFYKFKNLEKKTAASASSGAAIIRGGTYVATGENFGATGGSVSSSSSSSSSSPMHMHTMSPSSQSQSQHTPHTMHTLSKSSETEGSVFSHALFRITFVVTISTLCFAIRVCMLIAKMTSLHANMTITTHSFPLFGLAWFTLSDFIPRCTPCFCFISIMLRQKGQNGDRTRTRTRVHTAAGSGSGSSSCANSRSGSGTCVIVVSED